MKYYAGLDISMEATAICIVDQEGQVIHETMTASNPELIATYLKNTELEIDRVGLESGSITRWLTLALRNEGINAIAIDARKMSGLLKFNINKNDANDARGIADAMRVKMYKEVFVKSDESATFNALLNIRSSLVGQRVTMVLTVRGHLKSVGIRPGPLSYKNVVEKIEEYFFQLPDSLQTAIKSLLNIVESLNKEIETLDASIEEHCKGDKNIELLKTISGVGSITAAAFICQIEDPKRFKNSRSVGAYLGLTPRLYESGATRVMGRISKHGSSSVRSLLYQAAHCLLTRSDKWSKLKAWGLKIMRKHGIKKATVAVARKLAVIMHRMLLTEQEFIFGDPEKTKKKEKKAVEKCTTVTESRLTA